MQYTIALIKPDAYVARHTGRILRDIEDRRLSRSGDRDYQPAFTIGDIHSMVWTRAMIRDFYHALRDRSFFPQFEEFMTSAPMVALTLVGEHAVHYWRDWIGPTNPKECTQHHLRKEYGDPIGPIMKNALHGSDTTASAHSERRILAAYIPGFGAGADRLLRT